MLFNSYEFVLIFLPLCVVGYYAIINRYKANKQGLVLLLLFSLVYIGYTNILYLLMLIPNMAVCYGLCRYMNCGKVPQGKRRGLLISGIVIEVLVLSIFKYYDFFVGSINSRFSLDIPTVKLILPLGISFYTFQQIAYMVDCYRDDRICHTWLEYALFITYFPQFIQGPIVLQSEFIPQIRRTELIKPDYEMISKGLYRFTLGLGKKVLLADTLGLIVDSGYSHMEDVNAVTTVVIIVAYTLQIYFDFSGYSDMAIGVSQMLGITLPENFNSPYRATSIDEFWDRWHMTLTRFLTRYVYIPLGGSRKRHIRTYVNILIVFLISGLWHGAEWSFVIWGLMHGIAMLIGRFLKERSININKVLGSITTFILVNIAWVFFRAGDTSEAITLIQKLSAGGWMGISPDIYESFSKVVEISVIQRFSIALGMESYEGAFVIIAIIIMLLIALIPRKNTKIMSDVMIPNNKNMLVTAVLFVWCLCSFSGVTNYIYWNF